MAMEEKRHVFLALIYPAGLGYEVYVPDLDAYTQGDDVVEAAYMAQDLVETIVSHLLETGRGVPEAHFDRESPDGGYAMLVMTTGDVPEVADMPAADAADVLGTTVENVYAMCRRGVLDSRKVGSTLLVSTESVKRRQAEDVRPGRPRKEAVTA